MVWSMEGKGADRVFGSGMEAARYPLTLKGEKAWFCRELWPLHSARPIGCQLSLRKASKKDICRVAGAPQAHKGCFRQNTFDGGCAVC